MSKMNKSLLGFAVAFSFVVSSISMAAVHVSNVGGQVYYSCTSGCFVSNWPYNTSQKKVCDSDGACVLVPKDAMERYFEDPK